MKNIFKLSISIILIILFNVVLLFNSSAQLYEVEKNIILSESELVIEGEIIESECFLTEKGDIYTAHKVKIFKSFKGVPNSNFISIITRGGTLNGKSQSWTHLLTLNLGNKGVFFLEKTKAPLNNLTKVVDDYYYSVFASKQGFIRYNINNEENTASTPFHKYPNIQLDVIEKLSKEYNKPYQEYANITWEYARDNKSVSNSYTTKTMDDEGRCLDFLFEVLSPDINNPLIVTTIVSIKASETTKITKPVVVTKYSTSALGSNIYANGLVTLEQIGISANTNYTSIAEDIAPDKVKIEISANSLNEPDLYVITTNYTPLIKINLTLPGYVDPGILIDQETMETLSKYFDTTLQTEKYFDCMRIEGDFQAYACPTAIITGFSTFTADTIVDIPFNNFHAAGIDHTVLITGVCFGESKGDSYVEFTNAADGPDQNEWVQPLDDDYLTWSNEEIIVYVPSIGKDTLTPSWYAGSGPVRVYIDGVGTSTSLTDINIHYALRNKTFIGQEDIVPAHTLFQNLNNMNGEGGYSFYYDSNFTDTLYAEGAPAAFERALLKWQCETEVNFTIHDTSEWVIDSTLIDKACMIDFDELPIGTTTTLARTSTTPAYCTTGNIKKHLISYKFKISFNSNLAWYTELDTTVDITMFGRKDLESRALHELGHAQSLLHSNNPEDLMFWTDASPPLYFNREIKINDYNGANNAISLSEEPIPCNNQNFFINLTPYLLDECSPPVSIIEFDNHNGISIYPNPTKGEFTINLVNDDKIVSYYLFGVLGEVIEQGNISTSHKISISSKPNGMYFLKLTTDDGINSVLKLIKE